MVKYKEYLKNLIESEEELFARFKEEHDKFDESSSPSPKFHEFGSEVVRKLKKTEDKLCFQTERGQYNKYSSQLSDKFWEEVRKLFPKIDEVEVIPVTSGVNVDELF